MVTAPAPNNTSRNVRRGLSGKLYPDGRISLAHRGTRKKSVTVIKSNVRSRWACQQSATYALSHRKPASPRGRKGITSYGKRMVRCCAALLEQFHDRWNLTFGTVTIPALSPDELDLVLRSWPKILNRFMEELARAYARAGLEFSGVHVTEVQAKRWERSGVVGLHFHFLCRGRSHRHSSWAVTPAQLDEIWAMVLSRFIGRRPDTSKAARLEVPRRSVQDELAKYLSKGSAVIGEIIAAGKGDLLPSAWWGGTRPLKRQVEKAVIWLNREQCLALIDRQDELRASGKAWVLHHFIDRHDADNLPEAQKRCWVGATFGFRCDRTVLLAFLKVIGWQESIA